MENATVVNTNGIEITTAYFNHSTATGALFSFVFISDSGYVDFSRSLLLPFDRNLSHDHRLPFDLYPGLYMIHVYDIEHNGTLYNGVGYPAVSTDVQMHQGIF